MITAAEMTIELARVPDYIATRSAWSPTRSRKPSKQTVFRWHRLGVRGHKLETMLVGNRLYTSIEALDRFFARCAGTPATTPDLKTRGVSKEEARRLIP